MAEHESSPRIRQIKPLLGNIVALSLPSIASNLVTPLLGMTDVAIAGHMGGAVFLAAIAVGGNMFNLLYWLFGFLRMGSSGMTAQAYGAGDTSRQAKILVQALTVALILGILFIALQRPICDLLLNLMEVGHEARTMATDYFMILIWGAPAVLGSFVMTGWFLGMQNSRITMWISMLTVTVNIAASLLLAVAMHLGIKGLATGTLLAQWTGFITAISACLLKYRLHCPDIRTIFASNGLLRFFRINTDIFLRTLCLVAVTLWFTRTGASQGDEVLAANALLLQLFTLFSFFMDGFAFSAEAICGRLAGSGDRLTLARATKLLVLVSSVLAMLFTIIYTTLGTPLLQLLCDDLPTIAVAREYAAWAYSIPMAGFMAFVFDGIFIGLTATRSMLLSMACATAVYFAVYLLAWPSMHNHGLWLAFICYLLTRGLLLALLLARGSRGDVA